MNDNYTQYEQHSVFDQEPVYFTPVGAGIRFANYLIDTAVVYILVFAFFFMLGILVPAFAEYASENSSDFSFKILDALMSMVVFALMYTLIEGLSKGRSLGKLITGTVAVREDGQPFTWGDAVKRSFSRVVPFEPFSAFGGHPWHDQWSNTLVVKK